MAGGMGVAGDNFVSLSAREERTGVLSTGGSTEGCSSAGLLAQREVAFATSVLNVSSADVGSTSLGDMPDGCAGMDGTSIEASWDEIRLICAGRGISSASAIAAVNSDALLKRAAGSLARLRKITSDRAGGMFGFIWTGAGGVAVMCCIKMPVRASAWNGGTPVHISSRMR